MKINKAALKLPDPLLVRYYKESRIDGVKKVQENPKTRQITVTMFDGQVDIWEWLTDIGWVPKVD